MEASAAEAAIEVLARTDRDEQFQLLAGRLESLYGFVEPEARKGERSAVMTAAGIVMQQARLYGLLGGRKDKSMEKDTRMIPVETIRTALARTDADLPKALPDPSLAATVESSREFFLEDELKENDPGE